MLYHSKPLYGKDFRDSLYILLTILYKHKVVLTNMTEYGTLHMDSFPRKGANAPAGERIPHGNLCLFRSVPVNKTVRRNEMNNDLSRAAEIIESYDCAEHNLIAIMQEIQAEYKYLSRAVLLLIAEKLDISAARVYSVATFYENFSLEAKGKHIIKICDGTACHVRKSQPIYDAIHNYLGLTGKRKTSDDGVFTLETVACLGACGLAPVMTLDGEVHAKMDPDSALALLEQVRREEAAQ